jgi:hypothetical protein
MDTKEIRSQILAQLEKEGDFPQLGRLQIGVCQSRSTPWQATTYVRLPYSDHFFYAECDTAAPVDLAPSRDDHLVAQCLVHCLRKHLQEHIDGHNATVA